MLYVLKHCRDKVERGCTSTNNSAIQRYQDRLRIPTINALMAKWCSQTLSFESVTDEQTNKQINKQIKRTSKDMEILLKVKVRQSKCASS